MVPTDLNKRIRGVQDAFLLMKSDRERLLKKLDELDSELNKINSRIDELQAR